MVVVCVVVVKNMLIIIINFFWSFLNIKFELGYCEIGFLVDI